MTKWFHRSAIPTRLTSFIGWCQSSKRTTD